ncbi:MAG: hypothetical protein RR423_09180, partial [Hydrogenoanaerobacterium sp.]
GENMTEELMSVFQSSLWDTAFTIIKYLLIAFVVALPFIFINAKLKKKEQQAKTKREEAKITRAVKKALDEHDRSVK